MKIIAIPEVELYLESLKKILFENEYFGFEETAQKYVDVNSYMKMKQDLLLNAHSIKDDTIIEILSYPNNI